MTDKIYKLAYEFILAVQNAKYTDNAPVEYSLINWPEMQISRWEDIKALDKTAISLAAAENNFIEPS